MYVNKCIKCGREFETKNPKRVICPECLYPDKKMLGEGEVKPDSQIKQGQEENLQYYSSYTGTAEEPRPYQARPQRQYNKNYNNNHRQYNNNRTGYNQNRQGYNNNKQSGGRQNYNNNRQQDSYMQRRSQQNTRFNAVRKQNNRKSAPKQLLVSREQLEQIELLYKLMLPLPNPDAHEVIGEKIGLEPRKVFFGINLVRQKLKLPKLPFPKRKLAISPDQLNAIKMLYEPLLPVPPIGCHKIIASQLKMDEWRVHVGIGLVRSQLGLERWNQEREDAPAEFKKQADSDEVA